MVTLAGLYAEQLSGTAFTAPRERNQRSWLYRIRPSVVQTRFRPVSSEAVPAGLHQEWRVITPEQVRSQGAVRPPGRSSPSVLVLRPVYPCAPQFRWGAMPFPAEGTSVDFVQGLVTVAGAGDPIMKSGLAIYM
jgi:homogentisate 1,2-dioxygenase